VAFLRDASILKLVFLEGASEACLLPIPSLNFWAAMAILEILFIVGLLGDSIGLLMGLMPVYNIFNFLGGNCLDTFHSSSDFMSSSASTIAPSVGPSLEL
jgi:hypothetical protein